ncbi:LysR family transcriptional regulator [Companilactobacillus huachuanensis]|uniref:LysR family transcriptional regulator n=1 Tax=Companilactobacillus huachuanensis TaxID=2559914 RepID=A0ABW1RPT7_9LACO|nr:LysR family transcriptional regulator [Companilactobacillus huachuanensis]
MNIDTFKMIIAIVQTGSISGAAQQLGYAQSNISARVHQLETELRTTIFYRTNRGVILTDAGKKFYNRASNIVDLTEDTINQMKHPTKVEGNLRIGTLQSASETFLPPILTKYYHKFPKVRLAIKTGNPIDNVQQVLDYEIDGAIVGENIDKRDLISIPLVTEELCLISASPKTPDLKTASFLVFTVGCVYRKTTEDWLHSQNLNLHHPIEFNYLDAIMASVCAGLGISIVPKEIAQSYVDRKLLYMTELPKEFSSVQLDFIYRKDHFVNRPFEEFIKMLKNHSDSQQLILQ